MAVRSAPSARDTEPGEVDALRTKLREAVEQQTAIRQILETTSRSAFDVVPVMQDIAERSAALCEAEHAWVGRYTETRDVLLDAYWGLSDEVRGLIGTVRMLPGRVEGTPSAVPHPLDAAQHASQWPGDDVAGRQTDQRDGTRNIEDASSDPQLSQSEIRSLLGLRSWLHVPLVKEGLRVGAINLGRSQPGRFTDAQVRLVQTFAAQAVIAMENVRLFNETKEALERQTAISEILRVIAGSQSDVRPVLDAIVLNALRFCAAEDAAIMLPHGDHLKLAAHRGTVPVAEDLQYPNDGTSVSSRAFLESRTIAVKDLHTAAEFPVGAENARTGGYHAIVAAPLRRDGTPIGSIVLRRVDADPFSDREIAALESFADQAVIAMENARLFNETKAALERQTATADVLNAISSKAFDLPRVLDTVIAHATRLADAENGFLYQADGDLLRMSATYGEKAGAMQNWQVDHPIRGDYTGSSTGRAFTDGRTVHIPDVTADANYTYADAQRLGGFKTLLSVPLRREGRTLGVISMWRTAPRPFTDEQIALVETFADQAVIAIENVRLFNETEEKSAELETANRELAAASRHKSEFLANMSHELRTPLNAIIGFSDVLEQQMFGELNDRQREYTRDIASSGRHLLDLVNEILDLSKIEAGRMELEPSAFALADTIRGAVGFVRERATHHGIELAAALPDDLGTVVADERKVRQVLLNLLSNAVKFTPDGGRIAITARRADGEIQVSVRDTGIGIAPEDQPKVFEEFRQVGRPSERSREGTGLGLTLAKRFIELHGGRIWLESDVGKGTEFTFALPTEQPNAGSA